MPSDFSFSCSVDQMYCPDSCYNEGLIKKGQSAKVKAFTAHFPLKLERNINRVEVIAEQKNGLIFTGLFLANGQP